MADKYQSVNGAWPEGTREGRDLKPTPQTALGAARRLYRIGLKKTFRGKMRLTSGNRRTWIRSGVFYVNPDVDGGGWHELVHDISHLIARRLHGEAHGFRHAFIERELIKAVVSNGWLEGKLDRSEKPKPDPRLIRYQRTVEKIKEWSAKQKRAQTALRKLMRTQKYYENVMQA